MMKYKFFTIALALCLVSCSISTPNQSINLTNPTLTPEPLWKITTSTDEMSGDISFFAISPYISPTHQMNFPYNDVEAWIGVGCRGSLEWAYFGFSTTPNLVNTDIRNGYDEISTRIKWDDSIQNIKLTQNFGDKFLNFEFSDTDDVIHKLQTFDTLLLELDWFEQGYVYFKFPLDGASEGLKSIRSKCSK